MTELWPKLEVCLVKDVGTGGGPMVLLEGRLRGLALSLPAELGGVDLTKGNSRRGGSGASLIWRCVDSMVAVDGTVGKAEPSSMVVNKEVCSRSFEALLENPSKLDDESGRGKYSGGTSGLEEEYVGAA
jgi:hypothetical protein